MARFFLSALPLTSLARPSDYIEASEAFMIACPQSYRYDCSDSAMASASNIRVDARASPANAIIPEDILSEIFQLAMHQSDTGVLNFDSRVPTVSYLSSANPIKLGHVCLHWREVAINTSKLWSTICIDHPGRSHINLTKLWIERAQNRPLHITIRTERSRDIDLTPFIKILELFTAKLDHWNEIYFDIPSEVMEPLSLILKYSLTGFQQLEVATIYAHKSNHGSFKLIEQRTSSESVAIDSIWEKIHSSPVLKQVNWKRLYEGRPPPDHCPWARLTCVQLDYHVSIDGILEILSASPNMEDFRVGDLSRSFVSKKNTHSIPITLQRLHTFYLITPDDLSELFENVALPALENLNITNGPPLYGDDDAPFEHNPDKFRQFLEISRCFLKNVWLNDLPINEDELRSYLVLHAFQSVRRLRITSSNLITDPTIRLLTLQHTSTDILPELESVWFELRETEITDGLLANFVTSRWCSLSSEPSKTIGQKIPTMNEVRFTRDFWLEFGPKDTGTFSDLSREGLDISISPGALDMDDDC